MSCTSRKYSYNGYNRPFFKRSSLWTTYQFSTCKATNLFDINCKLHGYLKNIFLTKTPLFEQLLAFFVPPQWKKTPDEYSVPPQTNGQTEVVRYFEQYLRSFCHEKPSVWWQYLQWAEFHYNTCVHTRTDFSPLQLVYGKPPPAFHLTYQDLLTMNLLILP